LYLKDTALPVIFFSTMIICFITSPTESIADVSRYLVVKGAAAVFAETRKAGQELVIGSIKSNIGHSGAAAGVSGFIKAVLAVENGAIPGNPTFFTPNPAIDFAASRVRVTRTLIKWPNTLEVRRASINSFGFGGSNAHAIVENNEFSNYVSSYKQTTSNFFNDDDDFGDAPKDSLPTVLVLSANDQQSLKSYSKSLSRHLVDPKVSADITDLAYTLSERRSRHDYRAFVVTHTSKIEQNELIFGQRASSKSRIGFVFTGQGVQWPEMGKQLLNLYPQARKVVQYFDSVLQQLPNAPNWALLNELTESRSAQAFRLPEFSQPLVTALQLALEIIKDWGIKPQAVIGHSSGEIAAAAAAGLITPAGTIKNAYYRGQADKQVPPTEPLGVLAVGVSVEVIERYMNASGGKVQIACYNSPSSLTMSGTASALQ
jgi:acyl transferase domain-containing protein